MRLTRRAFRRLVHQALQALPPQALGVLDNVTILVQEWPTPEQMGQNNVPDRYGLLGLYEGVPRTERVGYSLVLPDRITLFQRPLEATCRSEEELVREVRTTVVHEIAHHLGWTDEDLERMGAD